MGPALLFGLVVAISLLVLGWASRRTGRTARRQGAPWLDALPWVVTGMTAVAVGLVLIPGVPVAVIAGVLAYTGVAIAATWRMVTLDRVSSWMLPSHRLARFAFSGIALVCLGLLLALLLVVADLVARMPS